MSCSIRHGSEAYHLMTRYYREIQIKDPSVAEVYDYLFNQKGDLLDDESGLSLGVYGLENQGDYQQTSKILPKWYIVKHKAEEDGDRVLAEIYFFSGFSEGLLIKIHGREGSDVPEIENFISKIVNLLGKRGKITHDSHQTPKNDDMSDLTAKPKWFPKKPATIQQWKRQYAIILQVDSQYYKDYKDGTTDDPQPKLEDYVERLRSRLKKSFSERHIHYVMAAGGKGWLK